MEVKPNKKDEPENWLPDEFITWSEVVYFWNCSYDFVERNRRKCDELHIPEECRCDMCQKELKKNYKTLYYDICDEGTRWYAQPAPDRKPSKVGLTCMKAFKKAHNLKYGEKES